MGMGAIVRRLLSPFKEASESMRTPVATDLSGALLSGRYELVELLEQDGDFQFYRARHNVIEKEFVLRLLLRQCMTPLVREQFTAQALRWSSSKTDRGFQLADYGECDEGMYTVESEPNNE